MNKFIADGMPGLIWSAFVYGITYTLFNDSEYAIDMFLLCLVVFYVTSFVLYLITYFLTKQKS